MKQELLNIAYYAMLHDIGKFYQRTKMKSDLSEEEKLLTPTSPVANYNTHLHSGYTSRFFHKYLKLNNEEEMLTSGHHLNIDNEFAEIIKNADRIASAIDRNDENYDTREKNSTGIFQKVRLSSILGEIDFGKERNDLSFSLEPLSSMRYPENSNYLLLEKTIAVDEYEKLFNQFISEIENDNHMQEKVSKYSFDRMYSLINEYTVSIPASTYEGNKTFVSLFDHLKLTSAIASCLLLSDDSEIPFCMFEFDISGIQKFIFKITEGKDTKRDVAKSLRGRSLFVSVITDAITYSFLHEFELTQSNIIFNTGGGALLLLPNIINFEDRINKISEKLTRTLYSLFGTDITFVSSFVKCDKNELESFRVEKAILLKEQLEEKKSKKFCNIMQSSFYFQTSENQCICKMCGSNFVKKDQDLCYSCSIIKQLSEYFVERESMYIIFDFDNKLNNTDLMFSIGDLNIHFNRIDDEDICEKNYDYIETINESKLGRTRHIANLVPLKRNCVLSFEEISEVLIPDDYGDKKLGVLKMDVDNLGAIFAFGLSNSRSLSKLLTLSRLLEMFFGNILMDICRNVSFELNKRINEITDNGTMFYINYAGGDDLVIIGPAAGILKLSESIQSSFNKFTCNKNFSISAGIHIQSPKEPIRFGIAMAEENLSLSKLLPEKNGISLINTTCKYKEYTKILEKVKLFKSFIDNNYISRTTFYNLLKSINVDIMQQYYKQVPIILYTLKRNTKNEETQQYLVKEFSSIVDLNQLKLLELTMKLTIMQTRG